MTFPFIETENGSTQISPFSKVTSYIQEKDLWDPSELNQGKGVVGRNRCCGVGLGQRDYYRLSNITIRMWDDTFGSVSGWDSHNPPIPHTTFA